MIHPSTAPYQYHTLRRPYAEGPGTGLVMRDHWAWAKRGLSVVMVRVCVYVQSSEVLAEVWA